MKKTDLIIILAIIVVVLAAMAFFWPHESAVAPTVASTVVTPVVPATSSTTAPSNVTLAIGERAVAGNVSIMLNSIVSDSRCPVDVNCIQAGWVTANVTLMSGTTTETTSITSQATPFVFAGEQVMITTVAPNKYSTITINPADYRLVFTVAKN